MRPHRALGRFAFSEKSSSILSKYAQYFQEQDDNVHVQRSGAVNSIVDRLWYSACPSPVIADIPAHEQRNDPIKYIVMNSKHECFNDFQNHNGQESHEQCPLYSFKEVREIGSEQHHDQRHNGCYTQRIKNNCRGVAAGNDVDNQTKGNDDKVVTGKTDPGNRGCGEKVRSIQAGGKVDN